jgi:hypothetical protein
MWLFMNLWHMLDPSLLNIRRTKSFNVVFPSVNDESTHVQFKGAKASEKRLAAMAAFGWTAEECLIKRPGEQEQVELAVLLNSENGAVKRQATTLLTSLRSKICNRFAQNDKVRTALVFGPPFEAHGPLAVAAALHSGYANFCTVSAIV